VKRIVLSALIAVCALGVASFDAHAKRLGGGGSSGMKRATPTQPHDASKGAPAQQAAPHQAAPAAPMATPPAAAPKRNWMGPIAGLAAGLGIAALFSHFGMGGALANIMTMLLIGFAAFMLIGFLMRRFAANKAKSQGMHSGPQFAGAGAPFPASTPTPTPSPTQAQPVAAPSMNLFNSLSPSAAAVPLAAGNSPAAPLNDGFDTAGFEQLAKRVFIRLQAANDAGDQNDLRRFTTPEMFGVVQQELLDRKGAAQRTDVLQLDAQIVERAQENGQQIVSVRFWGLIREQSDQAAADFDEVWHLTQSGDGWLIAGIQTAA